ncbi:MAG TPA: phosphoribosylformylglycinamidine cyclo-ligase [Planctomycetes bacterium]|nr:phosphoribosylformylglycinamidine cyclo-ligase [Planctomycetota bacterium]
MTQEESAMTSDGFQYDAAGVDTRKARSGLEALSRSIRDTLSFRDDHPFGRPATGFGYYANVLEMPQGGGLAIATDGVGTKILIAEKTGCYDTVPIDMIAMNVNDLICVGADPFALVDYIAVGRVDEEVFEALGRGLREGARQSGVTIPGGEIAQVKELLQGEGPTEGFDLVGTAVGWVPMDEVNLGASVQPGDHVLGLKSSGLHSNGYTLARRVLLEDGALSLDAELPDLGRTLGEELLEPTRIYVPHARALAREGLRPHALLHITGDGYCNLNRVQADVGFILDGLPSPPPIFQRIQKMGNVPPEEMHSVFNMGIGFCIVVGDEDLSRSLDVLRSLGEDPLVLGHATEEHPNEVVMPQVGLVGRKDRFHREG